MDFLIWLGQVWFFFVPLMFVAIVFYIYRPSARKKYKKAKKIPFEDRVAKRNPPD
ncbi:MAG: CcoQ/FixQ family Cbb3-type cytochrome c oxidase assembly chaperone [Chromatiales bacterium]|jgi:cbb3-type cytochrome oxidase subunit 3